MVIRPVVATGCVWLVNKTQGAESTSKHNDLLGKHLASSENVNPFLVWKVHTSWNFSSWKMAMNVLKEIAYKVLNLLIRKLPKVQWIKSSIRLPGVRVNALSGIPSPAVERSKIFFHWRVELPGWEVARKGPGLGAIAVAVRQWVRDTHPTPALLKGSRDQRTPSPAEARVTVNSARWHVPHRLLYNVHHCRF